MMLTRVSSSVRRAAKTAAAVSLLAILTGCIGIYDNRDMFNPAPQSGMSELDMLRAYGAPAFVGYVEDQKVYTYKVRDNKFIILVGVYDGYDLIVTVEGGKVVDSRQIQRPYAMTLFGAVPWAEAE